uniref:Beta-hexosaminidase n=1 Tax=Rhizophora mucronata TaxID=61149 RepID=A0A2P2K925_RHIMU
MHDSGLLQSWSEYWVLGNFWWFLYFSIICVLDLWDAWGVLGVKFQRLKKFLFLDRIVRAIGINGMIGLNSYSLCEISNLLTFFLFRGIGYPALWPSHTCREPLDLTKNFTFDVISGILTDMRKIFPFGLFHLGGDEVNTG